MADGIGLSSGACYTEVVGLTGSLRNFVGFGSVGAGYTGQEGYTGRGFAGTDFGFGGGCYVADCTELADVRLYRLINFADVTFSASPTLAMA